MIILFIPFIQAAGMFFTFWYMIDKDKRINDVHALGVLIFGVISIIAGYLGLSVFIGTFTAKYTFLIDIVSFVFPAFLFVWCMRAIFTNKKYKRNIRRLTFLNRMLGGAAA